MSNKQIGVGDMVQIVKPFPCGCTHGLGATFTVGGMQTTKRIRCKDCMHAINHDITLVSDGHGFGAPLQCLIKIAPPPEELNETTDKELEVPA